MARTKTIISKVNEIKREDIKKWGKNALLFLIPAIIVLLGSVADLVPKDASYGVILLYILNLATDALKKYRQENKYEVR